MRNTDKTLKTLMEVEEAITKQFAEMDENAKNSPDEHTGTGKNSQHRQSSQAEKR